MLYGDETHVHEIMHSSQNSNDVISDIIKGASNKYSTNQGNAEVSFMRIRNFDQCSTNNKAFPKGKERNLLKILKEYNQ